MTAYTAGGICQDVFVARLLTTSAPVEYTGGGIWNDEMTATLAVGDPAVIDPPAVVAGTTTMRVPASNHGVYAPRPA